jgi:hypothetical protein
LPSASFRFHLAMDTLAARLMVPLNGPIVNFHHQVKAPCRAHHKKRLEKIPAFNIILRYTYFFKCSGNTTLLMKAFASSSFLRKKRVVGMTFHILNDCRPGAIFYIVIRFFDRHNNSFLYLYPKIMFYFLLTKIAS